MTQRSDGPVVKPEVVHLFQIISDVVSGKIRVPAFQRPFVWNRSQMTDLLDSVRKQFPIGSLLLWRSVDRRETLPRIGPVALPSEARGPVSLLLDGHQRVSTLVGLLWPGVERDNPDEEDPGRWTVWFNAEDERFEHLKPGAGPQPFHFPIHRMMDTIDVIDESKRMLESERTEEGKIPKAPVWVKRVQTVVRTFQTYKLPVVTIEETDLNEAVEIFARLNTKGRSMSADEMFSALTYREGDGGFHLAREIDAIMGDLRAFGFGELERVIALRATLAVLDEDIYRTDWTRIGQSTREQVAGKLPEATASARQALKRAAEFLQSLGVSNDRLLPYAMQLVVLAAFFSGCAHPTDAQWQLLVRWFWVSSFTGWFASGNPSRVRHLVDEFRQQVALDGTARCVENLDLERPALPFPTTFDMRSSRTRALLNVMVARGPLDRNGQPIPDPQRHIKEYGPEALGAVCSRVPAKALRASPANRIIEPSPRDRAQGKTWLLALDPSVRTRVLESHFIDEEALEYLRRGEHDRFVAHRRDLLIDAEREFMAARQVRPPEGPRVGDAPIDGEGPAPIDLDDSDA